MLPTYSSSYGKALSTKFKLLTLPRDLETVLYLYYDYMEVIFIRHTSVDVPPGTCYGQSDVALRSTFPEEAKGVSERLNAYTPIDATYTSPLSRCVRLAEYCGYPEALRDARLLELNFGVWEMQRYDEIRDPRLAEWYADYLHLPATNGESFEEQLNRVSCFLVELQEKPYHRVAIFTHGGVIACAQVYAGLVRLEEAFSFVPPYGGIITLYL